MTRTPHHFELKAEVDGPVKRSKRRRGYAGRPGSGPEDETCGSCGQLARVGCSKTYLKCKLMQRCWTGSYGTDVKKNAPACRFWEKADVQR